MAISGFMVVRNVASQGYPFIEAIAAALPICDEFLVSDGHSEDETWDALGALAAAYPSKIRLFRDRWNWPWRAGRVIADVTNVLRARCRFDYCLNLQANEILHEATLSEIASLPARYPNRDLFRIPFLEIMGRRVVVQVDYRRRLFRNLPYIVSRGDGFDCGYEPRLMASCPRKLLRFAISREGEQLVYLNRPVYRFRALFPKNYITRIEERCRIADHPAGWIRELAAAKDALARIDTARAHPDQFWSAMIPHFDNAPAHPSRPLGTLSTIAPDASGRYIADIPKIATPLLDRWDYDVATSLGVIKSRAA